MTQKTITEYQLQQQRQQRAYEEKADRYYKQLMKEDMELSGQVDGDFFTWMAYRAKHYPYGRFSSWAINALFGEVQDLRQENAQLHELLNEAQNA